MAASSRTGVPVFKRFSSRPMRSRLADNSFAAGSPRRPPGNCSSPMCIRPRRNVPVVRTTVGEENVRPSRQAMPQTCWPCVRISEAIASTMVRFGVPSRRARMKSWYLYLSAWARGDWTAGPFERFSRRNCMPVASIARPISPPRASTSRAICPFAKPPTAGLQLILAIVALLSVTRQVRAPIRAAACAASIPACPPPMTMQSKLSVFT